MLGWIGLVVLAGCLIKSIDYGNGTNQWNVSIANVGRYVKVQHIYLLFLLLLHPRFFSRNGYCSY